MRGDPVAPPAGSPARNRLASQQPEALLTRDFALACAMQLTGSLSAALYILLPLFVRSLGGSETTIGLYAGVATGAAVLVRWPLGRWLDRLGRKRIMLVVTTTHAVAWLGYLGVRNLGWPCALLMVGTAVTGGAMFTSFVTYASDVIPITRRAQGLAWFGLWGMASNGVSPLLGEWLISHFGFPAFFLAGTVLASLCVAVIAAVRDPHERTASGPAEVSATSAASPSAFWFLMVLTAVFGTAEASVYTFLAPFLATKGGSVGTMFFVYAGTAVIVRVVSGHLPDRVGRHPFLAFALMLYGSALWLLPHVSSRLTLHLASALAGAGHGYTFPILAALVVDLAAGRRGRAVSWLTAMFDLGHALGNPALGAVAEQWGYRAMYASAGTVVLGAGCAVALSALRRKQGRQTTLG